MRKARRNLGTEAEDFVAELTEAAYRVALKHQFKGSFTDVQMDLWSALRHVFLKEHFGKERRLAAVEHG